MKRVCIRTEIFSVIVTRELIPSPPPSPLPPPPPPPPPHHPCSLLCPLTVRDLLLYHHIYGVVLVSLLYVYVCAEGLARTGWAIRPRPINRHPLNKKINSPQNQITIYLYDPPPGLRSAELMDQGRGLYGLIISIVHRSTTYVSPCVCPPTQDFIFKSVFYHRLEITVPVGWALNPNN